MENKLQKLKEIICKANPSIMELKVGCELRGGSFVIAGTEGRYKLYRSGNDILYVQTISKKDILGRPIRLADVLVAIQKSKVSFKNTYLVSVYGEIMDTHFFRRCGWNLQKNNIDDQSEKLHNWLYDLLK